MKKIKVLDHGFVKLLNVSGPVRRNAEDWPHNEFDVDIIDIAKSARISFNNFETDRTREQDLKLVKYLKDNNHTTPIEMIEVWLEMKLPIFVARQFVRHRTCTINEVSARYVTLPEEWYIPEIVGAKSTAGAKQGQEDTLPEKVQEEFKSILNKTCQNSYEDYLAALDKGIAPEHARMLLHVSHYTHWIWKQNLHNILHFLRLRLHPHAQIEARMYAKAILDLLQQVLPEITDLL